MDVQCSVWLLVATLFCCCRNRNEIQVSYIGSDLSSCFSGRWVILGQWLEMRKQLFSHVVTELYPARWCSDICGTSSATTVGVWACNQWLCNWSTHAMSTLLNSEFSQHVSQPQAARTEAPAIIPCCSQSPLLSKCTSICLRHRCFNTVLLSEFPFFNTITSAYPYALGTLREHQTMEPYYSVSECRSAFVKVTPQLLLAQGTHQENTVQFITTFRVVSLRLTQYMTQRF